MNWTEKVLDCQRRAKLVRERPELTLLPMLDQSSVVLKNATPPKPDPAKTTPGLDEIQHKKDREESMGKAYSGRISHKLQNRIEYQKTFMIRLDTWTSSSSALGSPLSRMALKMATCWSVEGKTTATESQARSVRVDMLTDCEDLR